MKASFTGEWRGGAKTDSQTAQKKGSLGVGGTAGRLAFATFQFNKLSNKRLAFQSFSRAISVDDGGPFLFSSSLSFMIS